MNVLFLMERIFHTGFHYALHLVHGEILYDEQENKLN